MITHTMSPAQREILRALGSYVASHPVAVLPTILDDGTVTAHLIGDNERAEQAAVAELAASLHLGQPERTATGWAAAGWPEFGEVEGFPLTVWTAKNDGRASVWCGKRASL